MGFFEKVKNMFTEEVEDDDVKVEQVKGETTKVSFEPAKKEEEPEEKFEETKKIEKIEKDFEETKVNKPVFFDDDDFKDLSFGVKEEKVKEEEKKEEKVEEPMYKRTSYYEEEIIKPEPKPTREIYGSKIEREVVVEEKKIFKPTPIISPVYGILDKNYHKEDIVSRNEVRTEEKENPIDSVRNKAYGTLEDDLENTLFGTNSILFKKDEDKTQTIEVNDDVLTNLTDDISKELDELLIKKEKPNYDDDNDESLENDIIPEEKEERPKHVSSEDEDDLLSFIDSTLYKDGEDE